MTFGVQGSGVFGGQFGGGQGTPAGHEGEGAWVITGGAVSAGPVPGPPAATPAAVPPSTGPPSTCAVARFFGGGCGSSSSARYSMPPMMKSTPAMIFGIEFALSFATSSCICDGGAVGGGMPPCGVIDP